MNPDRKQCATCRRLMSADDAHHRCQSCRQPGHGRRRWTRRWALRQLGQPLPEGLRDYAGGR